MTRETFPGKQGKRPRSLVRSRTTGIIWQSNATRANTNPLKILILGGTRFVGPYVVRELVREGHDVTIFHSGKTEAFLPCCVTHIHGDFARYSEHAEELRRLSPEVVVDMVPFGEEDAERLLAFRGIANRVVGISSQDVYRGYGRLCRTEPGPPDPVPLTEDSPLRERLSPAGLNYNKTAVERALMRAPDLNPAILRLPATHGPRRLPASAFPISEADGRSAASYPVGGALR